MKRNLGKSSGQGAHTLRLCLQGILFCLHLPSPIIGKPVDFFDRFYRSLPIFFVSRRGERQRTPSSLALGAQNLLSAKRIAAMKRKAMIENVQNGQWSALHNY